MVDYECQGEIGEPGQETTVEKFGVELGGQGNALGGFSNDGIE